MFRCKIAHPGLVLLCAHLAACGAGAPPSGEPGGGTTAPHEPGTTTETAELRSVGGSPAEEESVGSWESGYGGGEAVDAEASVAAADAPARAPSPSPSTADSTAGAPAPTRARREAARSEAAAPSGGTATRSAGSASATALPVVRGGGEADGAPVEVTVTVTVDEPAPPPPPQQQLAPVHRVLTAASVGDTDRRGNYLQYVGRHPFEASRVGVDVTRRVRFRVLDAERRPVRNARVVLSGQRGSVVGTTMSDGFFDYFPGVLGDVGTAAEVTVEAFGASVRAHATLPAMGDGQDVTLQLGQARARAPRQLDLAFLIDVTGSMEDELRYVNAEVADIVARVRNAVPEVSVRVGATFYRDRTDRQPLQEIPFTTDVAGFARVMHQVVAEGGGDYPEDLNAGLGAALGRLGWSTGDATRILVVVADAPPQRYATQFSYVDAMRDASQRGIRLVPVAASGADREVEFLFRAMATVTGVPYTYLTDESGVGNPHMEADTDRVAVEYWNDLLTRFVVDDLEGRGMHELIR